MRIQLIAAAAALLVAPGYALGQDQTGMSEGHLDAADTTDDGALALAEFQAYVKNAFVVLDVNADGYVTVAEAGTLLTKEQFDTYNTNGDDGISVAEIDAQSAIDFASIDRDGDGALD